MHRPKKIRRGLETRQTVWDNLPADGMIGTLTKRIRHDNKTKAFHRPGSQNGRKG